MVSCRTNCRICGGVLSELLDLGRQPSANRFVAPEETGTEFRFRLAIGMCGTCTMVQLIEDVPEEIRYHDKYRYRASGSATHRQHFAKVARELLATELTGPNPFIVEVGCNDGVMLETIANAGIRHLGVDPAKEVTELARARGINVLDAFFDDSVAAGIRSEHGRADVIFGANTVCHIAYQESLLRGVDALLGPEGVFVFEEPYLDTIIREMAFDQIYDEHTYYFTARSVQQMAQRYGFELVDVGRTPLHGGQIRYTLARPSRRQPAPAVDELLAHECDRGLADPATFERFARAVAKIRDDLLALLWDLRDQRRTVVGYGAPGKTATVTNYCGIGPELVPFVVDSTPAKQGLLVPGSHLPVRAPEAFHAADPDYALLFAWNHADEIMAKERAFSERGGKWIQYVPDVHVR